MRQLKRTETLNAKNAVTAISTTNTTPHRRDNQ
jgi:hypothetical protein